MYRNIEITDNAWDDDDDDYNAWWDDEDNDNGMILIMPDGTMMIVND